MPYLRIAFLPALVIVFGLGMMFCGRPENLSVGALCNDGFRDFRHTFVHDLSDEEINSMTIRSEATICKDHDGVFHWYPRRTW